MNRRHLLKALPAALTLPALAPAATEKLSGKGRLRSALCAYSFREALGDKSMRYEDLVHLASEQNIDGLDLTVYWFPDTSDSFLLPLKRLAYRMGVEIYSISIRTDMCQSTRAAQDKELGEVRKWVDAAVKLGAGHIRVFGGKVPKDATEDQAAGWVVDVLSRAGEYAGSKGVILGLENHGGITDKAARVVEIVRKIDSPWVGVNLDTGNFKTNVFPQIEMLVPYAVNVQVKADYTEDGVKRPGDWDRVAKLLSDAGYKGYLALEYEAKESPKSEVPRLLQKLRKVTQKYSA